MKVLAFGAHPDDIEIGMGGTIARHTSQKDEVLMVVACTPTDGGVRVKEARKAANILGAELYLVDLEPTSLIYHRDIIERFDRIVTDFAPHVVYTHWNHDSHQDHIAVSNVSFAVGRKNRFSMYMYEQSLPGGVVPYGFNANSFNDISQYIDVKGTALAAHESQLEVNGPQWIEALKSRASYRGYQIGVKHAEAFEVVKQIDLLFK
ncbi:PIG-L deacetylase family protein [Chloroflexota bacterium]